MADNQKDSGKDKERSDREKDELLEKHRPSQGGAHPTNPIVDPPSTPGRPDNKPTPDRGWGTNDPSTNRPKATPYDPTKGTKEDRIKANNEEAKRLRKKDEERREEERELKEKPDNELPPEGLDDQETRPGISPFTMNLGGETFGHDPTSGDWVPDEEMVESAALSDPYVEGQLPHRVGNEGLKNELVKNTLDTGELLMRVQALQTKINPQDEDKKEFEGITQSLQSVKI